MSSYYKLDVKMSPCQKLTIVEVGCISPCQKSIACNRSVMVMGGAS